MQQHGLRLWQRRKTTYTLVQSTAGTDEKTSTDGATDGNHLQMTRLERSLQLDNFRAIVLLLEGINCEAVSGHEALLRVSRAGFLGKDMRSAFIFGDGVALLIGDHAVFARHGGQVACAVYESQSNVQATKGNTEKRKENKVKEEREDEESQDKKKTAKQVWGEDGSLTAVPQGKLGSLG